MRLSPAALKAARLAADLSQERLAKAAGLSIDTIQRAEKGLNEPGANTLARIAAACDVSIDSLFVQEEVEA